MSAEEVEQLRQATREAHEVLKDLRRAVRDGQQLVKSIEAAARVAVESRMEPVVKQSLKEFGQALDKAIEDSTEAVFRRFDRITELLMGEDRASQRQGKPTIPELIERRTGQ